MLVAKITCSNPFSIEVYFRPKNWSDFIKTNPRIHGQTLDRWTDWCKDGGADKLFWSKCSNERCGLDVTCTRIYLINPIYQTWCQSCSWFKANFKCPSCSQPDTNHVERVHIFLISIEFLIDLKMSICVISMRSVCDKHSLGCKNYFSFIAFLNVWENHWKVLRVDWDWKWVKSIKSNKSWVFCSLVTSASAMQRWLCIKLHGYKIVSVIHFLSVYSWISFSVYFELKRIRPQLNMFFLPV